MAKVKVTVKEFIQVFSILMIWAFSALFIGVNNNVYTSVFYIILTLPGLYCWVDSIRKLQIYEGRRKDEKD